MITVLKVSVNYENHDLAFENSMNPFCTETGYQCE